MTRAEHGEPLRVLFVCSKNRWRSPTAEHIWRRDPRVAVRSAGTSSNAVRVVTPEDVAWADLVLVMEDKHRERLESVFVRSDRPPIEVLDIGDRYRFMSPELIDRMRSVVEPILAQALGRCGVG